MSHKQAEQFVGAIHWLWTNKEKLPSMLEWVGKVIAAFPRGAVRG